MGSHRHSGPWIGRALKTEAPSAAVSSCQDRAEKRTAYIGFSESDCGVGPAGDSCAPWYCPEAYPHVYLQGRACCGAPVDPVFPVCTSNIPINCPNTCRRILSQDTYWCHTVSVFTAFNPNRIGEYNTHCRIYHRNYCSTNCSTYWCTIHVGSCTVTVIVLRQRSDGEGTG